jgi:hypothetical protein
VHNASRARADFLSERILKNLSIRAVTFLMR